MNKKTILIIDDEEKIVEIESLILSMEGYEVLTANDGKMAIDLLENMKEPPDLILLDVVMPIISGLEVCKWIKQQPKLKEIPVLFLTAAVSDKIKEEVIEAGGSEYLEKPYSTKELFKVINKYLKNQTTMDKP